MAKYGGMKYGSDKYGSSAPTQPPAPTIPTGTAPAVPAPVTGSSGSSTALAGIPSVSYALDVTVEPFTAKCLEYGSILLDWSTPGATITDLVLVRSSVGYPVDTADGDVLYAGAAQALNQVRDTTVLPGQEYFYALFVKQTGAVTLYPSTTLAPATTLYPTASGVFADYTAAAFTRAVAVFDHASATALLHRLPRLYTANTREPIGEPDTGTQLAKFLSIFGFELDRMKTDLTNLLPFYDPMTAPGPAVPLLASLMGQPLEGGIGYRQTRFLARDASYIYTRKGSTSGIAAFVKALTGHGASVVPGENLFPDTDDCSFEGSTGRWSATTNATLTRSVVSSTVMAPPQPAAPALALPGGFTSQAAGSLAVACVSTGAMSITYAGTLATGYGMLVTPGDAYAFTVHAATAVTGRTVTLSVAWLDATGAVLSTDTQSSGTLDTTSYQRLSYLVTAPTGAVYASPRIAWATPATAEVHYLDCAQFEHLTRTVPNGDFEAGTLDPWTLNDPPAMDVNQLSNRSFETNTTGWSGVASGYTDSTLDRVVAPDFGAHDGTAVLRVSWPTSASGGSCAYYTATNMVLGQRYRFSVWAYVPAGSPRVRIAEVLHRGTSTVLELGDTADVQDTWVQLAFNTVATNATMTFGVITDEPTIAPDILLGTSGGSPAIGAPLFGDSPFAAGSAGGGITVDPDVVAAETMHVYLDDASLINMEHKGANLVALDTTVQNAGKASVKGIGFLAGQDSYLTQTIKVRPGTTYSISAFVNAPTFSSGALGDRGLYVDDGTGNPQIATLTATTSGFSNRAVTYTPVSSWLEIRLYIPQGLVYWDDVTLARTGPAAYADAREADIFVFPTRTNLVTNPSFTTSAADWNVTSAALSGYASATTVARSTALAGTVCGLVTHPTAAKSGVTTMLTDLIIGAVYTASVYVRVPAGSRPVAIQHDAKPYASSPTTQTIRRTSTANADGGADYVVTINEPSPLTDATFTALADTWTRISTTFTATRHVHTIGLYALATTAGQTFYLDNVLAEASPVLLDYFDGDSGPDMAWESTPELSRSQYFRNRHVKSTRLAARIPDVIPTGVPYAVRAAWPGA